MDGGCVMPQRFLDGGFDAETVRAMQAAFGAAREVLNLADTTDAITDFLAKTIMEQARAGERDPTRLCALALKAIYG